jgi:hypothetical protein
MLPLHWQMAEEQAGMSWGGGRHHARETKGLCNGTSCINTLAKLCRQDRRVTSLGIVRASADRSRAYSIWSFLAAEQCTSDDKGSISAKQKSLDFALDICELTALIWLHLIMVWMKGN